MQKLRSIFLFLSLLAASFASFAGDTARKVSNSSPAAVTNNTKPEMADALFANGKIYVVVVVLAIIFAAIIIFLIFLERKISKLEKESRHSL